MTEEAIIPIEFRDPEISKKVERRLVVLMDMCVWIDLAKAMTDQMARLRTQLRKLVDEGRLFCPLTASIIWELYKQPYPHAVRVATLMEELSLNICFASTEEIFTREVDATFEELCHGRRPLLEPVALFVPILGHITSHGAIYFPKPALFGSPQEFVEQLLKKSRSVGLVEFCELTKDIFTMPADAAPAYAETALRRKEIAGRSKEKARRIEEESALRDFVTPRFKELRRRLPIDAQLELIRRLDELPKDRYGSLASYLLPSMPSITHRINVFTLVGQNPGRKDRANDFFDLELIFAPLVYSNIFFTRDKWIRYILTSVPRPGAANAQQWVWTYKGFEKCLDKLTERFPRNSALN